MEPSESLAKVRPRPRGTRSKGGFGDLKKVKIRYFYCRNEETLLECERLVDSTILIGCNGRSASVLEDRRQTTRLNLVVSAAK